MICYNCFREFNDKKQCCPHCGYDVGVDVDKYPQALPCGTILNGQYTVGRVLGQGGFGITYVAQDYKSGERVAIKEYLPTDYSTRGTGTCKLTVYTGEKTEYFNFGKQKFLEEAKTLSQFKDDANICMVHRYFEENDTAYIVMEYIEGNSLDRYMAQNGGKLSEREAKQLLTPVVDALIYVHSKGVIHRDVAPDNIIVTGNGQVKLIDFGAARYSMGEKTRSLDVILKHGFAPIEQYSRHGKQGAYTDVYAMAATYYYAITGKVPPDSIDRTGSDMIADPSSLGADISEIEENVLLKALSVNAEDRFSNMQTFKNAMFGEILRETKNTSTEELETATSEQNTDEKERSKSENKPIIIAAAIALAAGIGIAAFITDRVESPIATDNPYSLVSNEVNTDDAVTAPSPQPDEGNTKTYTYTFDFGGKTYTADSEDELKAIIGEAIAGIPELSNSDSDTSAEDGGNNDIDDSDIKPSYNNGETEFEVGVIDESICNKYYHDGIIRGGTDVDAGDYYVISAYATFNVYEISNDPSQFKWTGKNRVLNKIHLESGEYYKCEHSLLVPVGELNDDDMPLFNIFLVGRDIPEGEYKVTQLAESIYVYGQPGYQVNSGTLSSKPDCVDNLITTKQTYIRLEKGQYLICNNIKLVMIK